VAQRDIPVPDGIGLHARPAALFVDAAAEAPGEVTISKRGGPPANAKSMLSVLGLDVRGGDVVRLTAEDDDVLDRLAEVIAASAQG
jgi:phosphocarrier protein